MLCDDLSNNGNELCICMLAILIYSIRYNITRPNELRKKEENKVVHIYFKYTICRLSTWGRITTTAILKNLILCYNYISHLVWILNISFVSAHRSFHILKELLKSLTCCNDRKEASIGQNGCDFWSKFTMIKLDLISNHVSTKYKVF